MIAVLKHGKIIETPIRHCETLLLKVQITLNLFGRRNIRGKAHSMFVSCKVKSSIFKAIFLNPLISREDGRKKH